MDDLDALEERIEVALGRIRAVVEAQAAAPARPDPAEFEQLQAENAELASGHSELARRLEVVEAKRAEDVAQLDALIAELRPLVEDADNA